MCWRARRCGWTPIHSTRRSTITCISARKPPREAVHLRAEVVDAIEVKSASGQSCQYAAAVDGRKLCFAERRCGAKPRAERSVCPERPVGGLVGGLRPCLLSREWPGDGGRAGRGCLQGFCGRPDAEPECHIRRTIGSQPQWRTAESFSTDIYLALRKSRPCVHARSGPIARRPALQRCALRVRCKLDEAADPGG